MVRVTLAVADTEKVDVAVEVRLAVKVAVAVAGKVAPIEGLAVGGTAAV